MAFSFTGSREVRGQFSAWKVEILREKLFAGGESGCARVYTKNYEFDLGVACVIWFLFHLNSLCFITFGVMEVL